MLSLDGPSLFGDQESQLSPEITLLIRDVVQAAAMLSDAELKTRVYLTPPMRRMLRIEKTQLVNLYNSPIELLIIGPVQHPSA